MKKDFRGFYAPAPEEYERLIKEGLIALDANVLLGLYQFPEHPRKQAIDVLEQVKDRLWISNFAALEFQLNRIGVIASGLGSISSAQEKVSSAVASLKQLVEGLELDKRGLKVDPKDLVAGIETLGSKLSGVIADAASRQLHISTADPIRDQLDRILENRVGPPPIDQAALDTLLADGEKRFVAKVPPGYKDADKEKNPGRAVVNFDGLKYERKFGDLLIWKQLIEHVRTEQIKSVLLITSDLKEDWWWIEHGKTLGPRPELIAEIRRSAQIDLFWAYSFVQFLENARKYLKADVSSESMEEIKQASRHLKFRVFEMSEPINYLSRSISREQRARSAFRQKMRSRGREVLYRKDDFPSFVSIEDGDSPPHGYEVKIAESVDVNFIHEFIDTFVPAELAIAASELSSFSLIAVIPKEQALREEWEEILADIRADLKHFKGCAIVFSKLAGGVLIDLAKLGPQDGLRVISRNLE